MNNDAPFEDVGRKHPTPGVHVQLGGPNWVLLTVTTEDRQRWLASAGAHRLLHQTWQEATAWLVSEYLLMPDHLHCFCAPGDLHFWKAPSMARLHGFATLASAACSR